MFKTLIISLTLKLATQTVILANFHMTMIFVFGQNVYGICQEQLQDSVV